MTELAAPGNVTVTDPSSTTGVVSWDPVDGAIGYHVELAPASGSGAIYERYATDTASTSVRMAGFNMPSHDYTVGVSALADPDSGDTSGTATEVTHTTPAFGAWSPGDPPHLGTIEPGHTRFAVQWTEPDDTYAGFYLYATMTAHDDDTAPTYLHIGTIADAQPTAGVVGDLDPDTEYNVNVVALGSADLGRMDGSTMAFATTAGVWALEATKSALGPNVFIFAITGGDPNAAGTVDPGDATGTLLPFTTDELGKAFTEAYDYTPALLLARVGETVYYTPTATIGQESVSGPPLPVTIRDPLALSWQIMDANTGTVRFHVDGAYVDDATAVITPDGSDPDTTITVECDPDTGQGDSGAFTYTRSGTFVPTVMAGDHLAEAPPLTVSLPITVEPAWQAVRDGEDATYRFTTTSGADPNLPTYVYPLGADDVSAKLTVTFAADGTGTTSPYTYTANGVYQPALVTGTVVWQASWTITVGQGTAGGGGDGADTGGGIGPDGTPFGPTEPTTGYGTPRTAWINGMPLNVTDSGKSDWMLTKLTGWRGSPASTLTTTQRPAAHGAWADPHPYLTARQLEATVVLLARDPVRMRDAVNALVLACPLTLFPLVVDESGLRRVAYVQRNGEVLVKDDADFDTYTTMSLPMVAADPRLYSEDEHAVTIGLPVSSGGLRLPTEVPFSIGAVMSDGSATITNTGTIDAPFVATITGPTDSPVTFGLAGENGGAADQMTYTATVPASRTVVIDTANRTVMLDGTTSRRIDLAGNWFDIPPGKHRLFFSSETGLDTGATLTITYRDAWM